MTYAFTFDASACTGCKACQIACKDKNNLPTGVLWRRVYEISGGSWQQQNAAWTNTVFAYNLSIACNHCEHPKCAGVCPVDAYEIRADGIVVIDESKCVGCGYCAWACPYDAPQYNPELGHMTKCNFCFDNIDAGLSPACVAACPMRVLNYSPAADISAGFIPLWMKPAEDHPYPMSPTSRTEPHLAVKPHAAMKGSAGKNLANREEIAPRKASAWEEAPLIIFTLLAQLSVGGFWAMLWIFPLLWTLAQADMPILRGLPLMVVGASLGLGMFFSFAHLGTKRNAWRVLNHLRKSWLSREILSAGLFGASWLAVTVANLIFHRTIPALTWLTVLLGFALVYSMSRVYRLPAKPMWDSWRTNASFFVSALLLGMMAMSPVLVYESQITGVHLPGFFWKGIGVAAFALLVAQLILTSQYQSSRDVRIFQVGMSLIAIFSIAIFFVLPIHPTFANSLFVLVAILLAEVAGRWQFYNAA